MASSHLLAELLHEEVLVEAAPRSCCLWNMVQTARATFFGTASPNVGSLPVPHTEVPMEQKKLRLGIVQEGEAVAVPMEQKDLNLGIPEEHQEAAAEISEETVKAEDAVFVVAEVQGKRRTRRRGRKPQRPVKEAVSCPKWQNSAWKPPQSAPGRPKWQSSASYGPVAPGRLPTAPQPRAPHVAPRVPAGHTLLLPWPMPGFPKELTYGTAPVWAPFHPAPIMFPPLGMAPGFPMGMMAPPQVLLQATETRSSGFARLSPSANGEYCSPKPR